MPFTYVTLVGTYETPDDQPATGRIELTPVAQMRNELTVISSTVTATLSGGLLSKRVAATTDPGTTSSPPTVPLTYKVRYVLDGQPTLVRYVSVPHDQGATLELEALSVLPGGATPGAGGGVETINGEGPDGAGNVVLSAGDVGAQPADADLTGLAALGDGVPVRAAGAWGLAAGTRDGTRYLRDDGTWQAVGAGGGSVSSVNGQTGSVVLDADDLGDGTSRVQMTTAERAKLSGVATGATANAADGQLRDRATHTGVQPWSSISDGPEGAQDAAATALAAGTHTGISFSYDDAGGRISGTVSGGTATPTPHPSDPDVYSFGATGSTPAVAPGAPTITSVTPGAAQVTVAFTPPASNGGAAISSYTVTASPGGATATGGSSPIVVGGLTNGTAYTFTATATNSAGTGPASAPSGSATPTASTAGPSSPGTSTPARWWIPFGEAPHCRVTWETGVTGGQAQVVWVASMPDVRARTTKLETGVTAQTQNAYQAYVQDLSTGLTVADSGTVLGTATSWTATTFTPVAGRRYKGFARVRATDGQWSPYSSTRFVAPTGVTKFFESYGMVGDGVTRSGTDYGTSTWLGPIRTAIADCSPGDVLKSNAPGVTIGGITVTGTAISAAAGTFTGRTGQKIMIYKAGKRDATGDAYLHRTTIASVGGDGSTATLTAAVATNIAAAAGTALVNYPEFWIGHIDIDQSVDAGTDGGVTIDGTGCLFTSLDANFAGFRTSGITDMTYRNIHYWSKNVTIRGNGLNGNVGHFFVEGQGTVGTRIIGCYCEHARDAGILFFYANEAHVVDCTADHTMADPFHVTGTTADIQFIRNLSVYCGDDAVANIGYRADGDAARPQRIVWEAPTVLGQDWGRGISFGGSKDCLVTDYTIDGGAMAAILIGADGDQANTEHVQLRRFTVTAPKTRVGLKPIYTQGAATGSTIIDDAPIKLVNNGSPVRQRDILIEDGTINNPGFSVQVVRYTGGEFQDGTVIIRGVALTGTVSSGLNWRDENTYPGHLDFRGISVPAGSTPAPAPTAANS